MDEAEVNRINSSILQKIANDPRTRRRVAEAIEEVEPTYAHHFGDVREAKINESVKAQLEADKAEREQERLRDRLEKERAELSKKYDEDQLTQITELGTTHGVDMKTAAKIYATDHPPMQSMPEPKPKYGERWQMSDRFEEFKKDPVKAALDGAYKDIDDIRAGRVRL